MVKLIANSPCAGMLPHTICTVTLSEVEGGPITMIAPFKGQQKAVSDALMSAMGVGFPAPNRTSANGVARVMWCGMGQALVVGVNCPDVPAACLDHSDAWAIVRIDGVDAAAVLARLTPIDLRATTFKTGHTARTLIGHMTAGITRIGEQSFEVMVMRSMAATLVHELVQTAEKINARAGLPA